MLIVKWQGKLAPTLCILNSRTSLYRAIRDMSLKFVDSLSTAQHKQLLVLSAISLYPVMYQESMCEK